MNTLAIDIGGTGLKAAVLDEKGAMVGERVRVETPPALTPSMLLDALTTLVRPLSSWDRVSVGFPGVVRGGRVLTAPNLGTSRFAGFDLAAALQERLGTPTRVINDADMQGLAVIEGRGVEMVVTLGTGFGTALFANGRLGAHLELAHHPFRKGETYDEQLGERARKQVGNEKWNRRVARAIENLRALVMFDKLFIGGGNARRVRLEGADDVCLVENRAGILGGIKLWSKAQAGLF